MRSVLGLILLLALGHVALAQDKLVVSGASGQLGGLVVDELLARKVPAKDLILVSRTPNTEAMKAYAAKGASVRFGDFTKPESLAAAYAGGTKMLLISVNGGGGQRPELHKAAIDAAIAAGVKLIAYTSYVNADVYLDSTIATDHRRTEQYLKESGVAWTLLRNQIYADGLVDQAVQIVRERKLVTFTPDARVAYVTREDCAAAAAAVLATPGHENRAYNITGPDAVGPRELVALASEVSGKRVDLVVMDEAAYAKSLSESGMPESAIRGALTFAKELNSPYLREPSTAVADLTGRPATSVRKLLTADRGRLRAAAAETGRQSGPSAQ
ncbi:MAG TPA: NAD(P)H-binding protein [Gammaproteobacteria bacterium]|nr:NAD(P)H-binding protein [Gammaproteobacteria bacterium]